MLLCCITFGAVLLLFNAGFVHNRPYRLLQLRVGGAVLGCRHLTGGIAYLPPALQRALGCRELHAPRLRHSLRTKLDGLS